MDHAQWLLDYFFEHATEENVCHLICGKEVCEKCWRYRILKWEKEDEEIWYFTLCFKFILLISEVFACNNNLTLFCNNPFYRQNKGNPINQSYIRWITRQSLVHSTVVDTHCDVIFHSFFNKFEIILLLMLALLKYFVYWHQGRGDNLLASAHRYLVEIISEGEGVLIWCF